MRNTYRLLTLVTVLLLSFPFSGDVHAGVFGIPHFVTPGNSALGLEPEFTMSNGAGIGIDLKYTYGLSELNNVTAILGTGTGPRQFRAGGNFTFDIFPDIPGQPGIGIATQGVYYRLSQHGQFEVTGIPYIHKSFINEHKDGGKDDIEPFLAVPFGWAFYNGTYQSICQVAVGALFKASEKFHYVTELGIAVNNSDSYISGGFLYYF